MALVKTISTFLLINDLFLSLYTSYIINLMISFPKGILSCCHHLLCVLLRLWIIFLCQSLFVLKKRLRSLIVAISPKVTPPTKYMITAGRGWLVHYFTGSGQIVSPGISLRAFCADRHPFRIAWSTSFVLKLGEKSTESGSTLHMQRKDHSGFHGWWAHLRLVLVLFLSRRKGMAIFLILSHRKAPV